MKLDRISGIKSGVIQTHTVFILTAWPTPFEGIFIYIRVDVCREIRLILRECLK